MHLSDKELHAQMIRLRRYERDVMMELLEHLQEVYDRRLFADFGYSSLIKYLVKELGYSESAAFRRYQTLKLTREIPRAKEMLEKGELNLTSASMIQGGLKSIEDRRDILDKAVLKTTAETQALIIERNPDIKKKDIINPIDGNESRVHITLSKDTLEKMGELKALKKIYNTDEIINYALEIALSGHKKKYEKVRKQKSVATTIVPSSTVKKLRLRAGDRCEYEGCREKHNLEIEHIVPRAKGGGHNLENLKLYCRAHNQRAAIKEFGQKKMNQYLNKKATR